MAATPADNKPASKKADKAPAPKKQPLGRVFTIGNELRFVLGMCNVMTGAAVPPANRLDAVPDVSSLASDVEHHHPEEFGGCGKWCIDTRTITNYATQTFLLAKECDIEVEGETVKVVVVAIQVLPPVKPKRPTSTDEAVEEAPVVNSGWIVRAVEGKIPTGRISDELPSCEILGDIIAAIAADPVGEGVIPEPILRPRYKDKDPQPVTMPDEREGSHLAAQVEDLVDRYATPAERAERAAEKARIEAEEAAAAEAEAAEEADKAS